MDLGGVSKEFFHIVSYFLTLKRLNAFSNTYAFRSANKFWILGPTFLYPKAQITHFTLPRHPL